MVITSSPYYSSSKQMQQLNRNRVTFIGFSKGWSTARWGGGRFHPNSILQVRSPSALPSVAATHNSSLLRAEKTFRSHSCSAPLVGGKFTNAGYSFYLSLRSALPAGAQSRDRAHPALCEDGASSITLGSHSRLFTIFTALDSTYLLDQPFLLRVLLTKCQVLRVKLLIVRRVYYLWIYLLLVMVVSMETAPIHNFAAPRGETYAMDIKGVELWGLIVRAASERHFSYLKLWFFIGRCLLLLPLSILLHNFITKQHFSPFYSDLILYPITSFIISHKQNKHMTHFHRSHKTKKDRYEQAIQSDPANLFQDPPRPAPSVSDPSVKSATFSGNMNSSIRGQNVGKLVEGLDRAQSYGRAMQQRVKNQQTPTKRSVNLNMMRLQDKHFQLSGNIYNIAVGQIINRQAYLANLSSQIGELRSKIRQLEEEDEQMLSKTIQVAERERPSKRAEVALDRSRTIQQRKSNCGRIYTRMKTPSSGRGSVKLGNSQGSSFYKWKPAVEQNQFVDHKDTLEQQFSQDIGGYGGSGGRRKNGDNNQRNISNYRVKQRNVNKSSIVNPFQAQNQMQKSQHNQIKSNKKLKDNKTLTQKSDLAQKNQHNPQNNQKQEQKIELQPYSGIVFQKGVLQWQIAGIQDNFRQKITKKLQIPEGFPLQSLDIGHTIQEYEKLGHKVFALFSVKIDRQPNKLITRKFKNGLYYQLAQGKNILWYYSGTFYFGDWETDLPTQSQKNGFGFQYVPNKYIYLGDFKDGMRHGNGTIKVFSSNGSSPEQFMGYDGEWANGKPNGYGKHIDEKDTRYIGQFVAGEKLGKATILNQEGLYYQGQVKKGLKNGQGFQRLTNGDTYTGQFQQGKFNGWGSYKWKNGSTYEGQFVKGKREGRGKWRGADGDEFQGEYFDDVKNGWGKFIWANGEIYQGEFRNDIRHGQGTYRHPNGKLGKFMWIEGKIDHRIYTKQEQQYRCRNLKEDSVPTE